MNRDEYLQNTNEGFIKDTLRKGVEKIKSLFTIGMKKIKNFIALFDANGHVLPVVSLQAVIDWFSNSRAVKVFAPKEISQNVIDAGGAGCSDVAELKEDEGMYDVIEPDSIEYRNYLTLGKMLSEGAVTESLDVVDESWDAVKKKRNMYSSDSTFGDAMSNIDYDEFEELLNDLIEDRIVNGGKVVRSSDGLGYNAEDNYLIFGAPGIGKSTIPNSVVAKFNEKAKGDQSKMISIITVDCGELHAGDFIMPTMPKEIDIMGNIQRNREAFPTANAYIDSLGNEEQERVKEILNGSLQFKSTDAPKSWLPSYHEVGDDAINKILDDNANGGVFRDDNGKVYETGNGGIILFDELLRADEDVFKELMNFLLFRRFKDWVLGSKWIIIACSNRPDDDAEVKKTWGKWNGSGAKKGRYTRMLQLVPDPESWKEWAKSQGCHDIIFDFIFDKSSREKGEYPRWHTHVVNGAKDEQQTLPVDPRQWAKAINAINMRVVKKGYPNMLMMSSEELEKVLKGIFDPTFITEFVTWYENHRKRVDMEMIFADPTYLKLDDDVLNDVEQYKSIINNLSTEIVEKFKDDPSKLTDDKLANVMIWMSRNFKNDVRIPDDFLNALINDLLKDEKSRDAAKSEKAFPIAKYIKTMMTMEAAYPMNYNVNSAGKRVTFEESINRRINREIFPWPENSMEIIKGYMKEYFPWRIQGDEIKYYDEKSTKTKGED